MSRQLAEIQETHARLTELHRQATSPRMRNRLRMLMLLHDNPERPLADVARELECAERSVLRWWSIYRGGGLDALMETRHKGRPSQLSKVDIGEIRAQIAEAGMTGLDDIRAWLADRHGLRYSRSGMSYVMREILRVSRNVGWLLLDDDLTGSESPENAESLALDNPAAVINLLNSLPMTDDVVEWGNGFRAVLQRLLPDVDRISVNVNRRCDIRRPELYTLGTRISRMSEGGDEEVLVATHRTDESPSIQVIESLRAKGMPLSLYHAPVVRDYYLAGTAYLGSLFLWRSTESEEIPETSQRTLDELEPFIVYALSDVIVRHQIAQPVDGVFHEAMNTMFQDAGLSAAERRVVALQLLGKPYKDIADTMAVGLDAVKKHVHTIYKKTGTRGLSDLFAKYFTARLRSESSRISDASDDQAN